MFAVLFLGFLIFCGLAFIAGPLVAAGIPFLFGWGLASLFGWGHAYVWIAGSLFLIGVGGQTLVWLSKPKITMDREQMRAEWARKKTRRRR